MPINSADVSPYYRSVKDENGRVTDPISAPPAPRRVSPSFLYIVLSVVLILQVLQFEIAREDHNAIGIAACHLDSNCDFVKW
jgi:hypothetical protein